jgi:peptidoglycan/xylan/chitin deacetylase (PgdA/CDA1 family)
VTFDDAFRSAAGVFPALRQLGIPIQLFVCTSFARNGSPLTIPELDTDNPTDLSELATMSWDEIRTHSSDGVQVGSHTVTHAHLTSLSDAELARELSDSKEQLETELRAACTELAYPYGEYDSRVSSAARAASYTRAYALWAGTKTDPYSAPRLDLYRRHSTLRALLMATPLHRLVA